MSNVATIQPTVFHNYNTEDKTHGVRVYDSYSQTYDNTWESIPDDDMEILRLVKDNDNEIISGIIDFIVEDELGIMIGKEYYEWDIIKDILKEWVVFQSRNI